MGFSIQFTCKHCGFQTPDEGHSECLIDPMGVPSCNICECKDCKKLFHRPYAGNNELLQQCAYCGSKNIVVYDDIDIPCPVCGADDMELECVGTFF